MKSAAGLWQVNPPKHFLEPETPPAIRFNHRADTDKETARLLDALPAKLRQHCPLRPQASAAAAVTGLREALLAPSPLPLLGLLDLTGPAKTARDGCLKAVALWFSLHDPDHVRSPILLDSAVQERTATASFQLFSARLDRLDLRVLYFERGEAGWQILAGLAPDATSAERFAEASAWAGREASRWTDTWRTKVLADSPVIVNPAAAPQPTDEQARTLLGAWFSALRGGDLTEMLKLTARLDAKSSPTRLLRNLGYEINTARKTKIQPSIAGIARGKSWVAAAVRTNLADKPVTAVYPVVSTPDGPRLLIETDLFISPDRGREFLNRATFDHVSDILPAATAGELKEVFAKLAETTAPK